MGELHYNSESTPTTGETVIPTLGWDFELHQPLVVSTEEDLPTTSTSSPSLTGAATASESNATSSGASTGKDFITPKVKNFFAPLKAKGKMQLPQENVNQDELRPDLCIGNVLACDTNKVATIRRPHNPLKCPIGHDYANVSRPIPPKQVSSSLFSCCFHLFETVRFNLI